MRGQLLKSLLSLITLLCVGSLLTSLIWFVLNDNNVEPQRPNPQKKSASQSSDPCKGCREVIEKVIERYSQTWKKQEDNNQKFRSQLSSKCHGFDKAIITQANTPVGSKLVYDGEKKRSLQVTPEIFSTFTKVLNSLMAEGTKDFLNRSVLQRSEIILACKDDLEGVEHPFANKTLDTCAVVGNGGILTNSSCGQAIDSAQFVIRCNLPPLENGYEKHVGVKTDLVTANPSILIEKYGALMGRRRPFVKSLRTYGNSLLLLPAFSYGHNTPVSLRASYTIEDFESPIRPIFFNPDYLQSLALFWRSQGLKAVRLSSGIIMASLALELCANVHLYGFWPFSNHPHDFHALTNHYYDNRQTKVKFHAMPTEFDLLLRLHSQGVLRIHLGDCQPGEK